MDVNIKFFTSHVKNTSDFYVPFTSFGVCSKFDSKIFDKFSINEKIDNFTLRTINQNDKSDIIEQLRLYGSCTSNYQNLELFSNEQLEIISNNMVNCFLHKYYVTFVLEYKNTVIGFLQIDPYFLQQIIHLFGEGFLSFLKKINITIDDFLSFDIKKRNKLIKASIIEGMPTNSFSQSSNDLLINFIERSVETIFFIKKLLKTTENWIGNLSYNLLPEYHGNGFMSKTLNVVTKLAKSLQCSCLFADRIAEDNIPSTKLLKNANFIQGGRFISFYDKNYHTRMHPNGNFSEICVNFYKIL